MMNALKAYTALKNNNSQLDIAKDRYEQRERF